LKIELYIDDVLVSSRNELKLIQGSNVTLSVSADGLTIASDSVVATAATASVSSTQTNLINYTPQAVAGRYRLSYIIANTAGTNTGTTTPVFTYKDAVGIEKSYNIPMAQEDSVTWLLAAVGASKNFSGSFYFSIDNSATAITATFTVSGTVETFISVSLEQLS
jgi:hypothetical protein